ncbi:hypothetical protein BSKO_07387 [Bryopsis sp. KO-2023]|nr:hypothetical protein BSKO_07387 [Bryopsis sp. KO-2023]
MPEEPAILKRLALLDEQRKAEREKKREESRGEADPRESGDKFLEKFNAEVSAIETRIEELSNSGSLSGGNGKERIAGLLSDIASLDSSLSTAAYFLPKYEVRQGRATVQNLANKVENVKASVAPKKKFAFSKRSKEGIRPKTETEPENNRQDKDVTSSKRSSTIAAPRGLTGLRNQEIWVSGEELGSSDYALRDVEDCTVFLIGALSALHIRKLRNCTVVAGPVKGATFLEDVSNCQLHLVAHQVRIHSAVECSFYLRVGSNPIIEYSSKVGFAPLSSIENVGDEWTRCLEASSLTGGSDLWSKVNDFGWLKKSASPNWFILDGDQRKAIPKPPKTTG